VTATPTITTTLHPSTITVPGSTYDSATISGATSNAGGSVTYYTYTDSSCSLGQQSVVTRMVTNGVVSSSTSVNYVSPGSFSWNAVYSGDAHNYGETSSCEHLTVNKATPRISTSLSSSVIAVGGSAYDTSSISGGYGPTGQVKYYFSTTNTCPTSGATLVSTVTISGGVIPNSQSHTFNSGGYYYWYATYQGDGNNVQVTSSCEQLLVGYYLTMQMTGGGQGTVSPSSGWYSPGSQVHISAVAGTGYHFCYWTGTGTISYSGSSSTATITMNSAITETATIKLTCPSSPINPSGGGPGILPSLAILGISIGSFDIQEEGEDLLPLCACRI
jgi:Divergent InlB B-repeat domain